MIHQRLKALRRRPAALKYNELGLRTSAAVRDTARKKVAWGVESDVEGAVVWTTALAATGAGCVIDFECRSICPRYRD